MPFRNREDAGSQLAQRLAHLAGDDVVVLGLPRGGVPVAFAVARTLNAPLDITLVRKLGVPYQPELAMGAIGEDGVRVLNPDVVNTAGVSEAAIESVEDDERAELERRLKVYRKERERVPLVGRTAIVVDDGIATGATARAACHVVRGLGATRVILAVPVAPSAAISMLEGAADDVVTVDTPHSFYAIGQWYDDFTQTSDAEVTHLLDKAAGGTKSEIAVVAGDVELPGYWVQPAAANGVVVFAHGSGSGRDSPRNQYVARVLNDAGLATLLLDLLTPTEAGDRSNVFDIRLLATRVNAAVDWVRKTAGLPLGLFGASTGAAAALWVAADDELDIRAVVSRGGRPDLAIGKLTDVQASTLLIVGGSDDVVVELNRQAADALPNAELTVVRGATHLFEEPGALEIVATKARDWFGRWL